MEEVKPKIQVKISLRKYMSIFSSHVCPIFIKVANFGVVISFFCVMYCYRTMEVFCLLRFLYIVAKDLIFT